MYILLYTLVYQYIEVPKSGENNTRKYKNFIDNRNMYVSMSH
jgi:hypothetical protein